MKKGFKFSTPRPKEHNEKIAKAVSKAYTEERKSKHSKLMKKLWSKIERKSKHSKRMKELWSTIK